MASEFLSGIAVKAQRSRAIRFAMQPVLDLKPAKINAFEVGTMFKLDEGISTWVIADALRSTGLPSHLMSFELDPTHIESSKKIVAEHDPELLGGDQIEWIQGPSLDTMPKVLTEMDSKGEKINFALLDGNGHPEYNMCEFEMIYPHMAEDFIILYDDYVYLKPSEAYPYRRPFGKPQTFMTFMLMKHTLDVVNEADAGASAAPQRTWPRRSKFLDALRASSELNALSKAFDHLDWIILQTSMIAVGPKHMIAKLKERDPAGQPPKDILQIRIP